MVCNLALLVTGNLMRTQYYYIFSYHVTVHLWMHIVFVCCHSVVHTDLPEVCCGHQTLVPTPW